MRRKCDFMARAVQAEARSRTPSDVHARAEAWPAGQDRFDLVTARALAPLAVVAEYAAPLLKIGGTLAWKGGRDAAEESAGERAAAVLGLELADVRSRTALPAGPEPLICTSS